MIACDCPHFNPPLSATPTHKLQHSDGPTTHHCVFNFYTYSHVLLFLTCTCVRPWPSTAWCSLITLSADRLHNDFIVIKVQIFFPPRPTCPYPRGAIPPIYPSTFCR